MAGKRNAQNVLMEKLKGREKVESHWYRWKDNINVHVGERG